MYVSTSVVLNVDDDLGSVQVDSGSQHVSDDGGQDTEDSAANAATCR